MHLHSNAFVSDFHCLSECSLLLLFPITFMLHRISAVTGMRVGRIPNTRGLQPHSAIHRMCGHLRRLFIRVVHITHRNSKCKLSSVQAIAGMSAVELMFDMPCQHLALARLEPVMFCLASQCIHPPGHRATAHRQEHINR